MGFTLNELILATDFKTVPPYESEMFMMLFLKVMFRLSACTLDLKIGGNTIVEKYPLVLVRSPRFTPSLTESITAVMAYLEARVVLFKLSRFI